MIEQKIEETIEQMHRERLDYIDKVYATAKAEMTYLQGERDKIDQQ